jgi:hypothetical protein
MSSAFKSFVFNNFSKTFFQATLNSSKGFNHGPSVSAFKSINNFSDYLIDLFVPSDSSMKYDAAYDYALEKFEDAFCYVSADNEIALHYEAFYKEWLAKRADQDDLIEVVEGEEVDDGTSELHNSLSPDYSRSSDPKSSSTRRDAVRISSKESSSNGAPKSIQQYGSVTTRPVNDRSYTRSSDGMSSNDSDRRRERLHLEQREAPIIAKDDPRAAAGSRERDVTRLAYSSLDAPKPRERVHHEQRDAPIRQAPRNPNVGGKIVDLSIFSEQSEAQEDEVILFRDWLEAVDKIKIDSHTTDLWANTVLRLLQSEYKFQGVFKGGPTDTSVDNLYALSKALRKSNRDVVLASILEMKNKKISMDVAVPTFDSFCATKVTPVKAADGVFTNGTIFLDLSRSPALFASASRRMPEMDKQVPDMIRQLLVCVTSEGLRTTLSLEGFSHGRVTTFTWSMLDAFSDLIGSCSIRMASMIEVANSLVSAGATGIIGRVSPRSSRLSVLNFIKFVNDTIIEQQESERDFKETYTATLLRNWRIVRQNTILDSDPAYKHPYFMMRSGDNYFPYTNTHLKMIDAYVSLHATLSEFAKKLNDGEKILVIYGGVTTKGHNVQVTAARHFFTTKFGAPITDAAGRVNKHGKWNFAKFDLVPNNVRSALSLDASDPIHVSDAWSEECQNYAHVIVVLDLADNSVNPTSNISMGKFISNFLSLPNVRFVTSKYCVIAPITIGCASRVTPLTSTMTPKISYRGVNYAMPTGREHGIEGIVCAYPGDKTILLRPFLIRSDGKFVSSNAYNIAFNMRMIQASVEQLAPRAVFEIPKDCSEFFPASFGGVSRQGDAIEYGQTDDVFGELMSVTTGSGEENN